MPPRRQPPPRVATSPPIQLNEDAAAIVLNKARVQNPQNVQVEQDLRVISRRRQRNVKVVQAVPKPLFPNNEGVAHFMMENSFHNAANMNVQQQNDANILLIDEHFGS